jgi:hypothetical protein
MQIMCQCGIEAGCNEVKQRYTIDLTAKEFDVRTNL